MTSNFVPLRFEGEPEGTDAEDWGPDFYDDDDMGD